MRDEKELLLIIRDAAEKLLAQPVILPTPEAKAAFGRLNQAVVNHRDWTMHSNEPDDSLIPPWRLKPCKYCGATIFFAEIPEIGRKAPFEEVPVPAAEVVPAWRYFIAANDLAMEDTPRASLSPSKHSGEVYVHHISVCGNSDGPKYRCAIYERRYRLNRERATIVNQDLAGDLVRLRNSLRRESS